MNYQYKYLKYKSKYLDIKYGHSIILKIDYDIDNDNDLYYQHKYLKYKSKYLDIKLGGKKKKNTEKPTAKEQIQKHSDSVSVLELKTTKAKEVKKNAAQLEKSSIPSPSLSRAQVKKQQIVKTVSVTEKPTAKEQVQIHSDSVSKSFSESELKTKKANEALKKEVKKIAAKLKEEKEKSSIPSSSSSSSRTQVSVNKKAANVTENPQVSEKNTERIALFEEIKLRLLEKNAKKASETGKAALKDASVTEKTALKGASVTKKAALKGASVTEKTALKVASVTGNLAIATGRAIKSGANSVTASVSNSTTEKSVANSTTSKSIKEEFNKIFTVKNIKKHLESYESKESKSINYITVVEKHENKDFISYIVKNVKKNLNKNPNLQLNDINEIIKKVINEKFKGDINPYLIQKLSEFVKNYQNL